MEAEFNVAPLAFISLSQNPIIVLTLQSFNYSNVLAKKNCLGGLNIIPPYLL